MKTENLPAKTGPGLPATRSMAAGSIYFDIQKFEHAQRVAKTLATAKMVPEIYRDSVGDCLIAIDLAERLQASPFMVMQNTYMIKGKPGLESKLVIALVNNSGRFSPIQYEEDGDLTKPANDQHGCTAYATDLQANTILKSVKITWAMVKGEGWYGKDRSKWKSGMAPQMFRYRSAAFFARAYCPEVLLGMSTNDELVDYVDAEPTDSGAYEVQAAQDPQDPAADTFAALVEKLGWDKEAAIDVEKFVEFSAEHNGKTQLQIKEAAIQQFDAFWQSYVTWSQKTAAVERQADEHLDDQPTENDDDDGVGISDTWRKTLKGLFKWITDETMNDMALYGHAVAKEMNITWPEMMKGILETGKSDIDTFCTDFISELLAVNAPGDLDKNDWKAIRQMPGGYNRMKAIGVEEFFEKHLSHIQAAPKAVQDDLRDKWARTHDAQLCPLDEGADGGAVE